MDELARTDIGLEFAILLRQFRQRAGLTQEELAAAAGLSPRGLGNLERGRTAPHRTTVARLSRALSLTDADHERLRCLAPLRVVIPMSDREGHPDLEAAYSALDADTVSIFHMLGVHPLRRVAVDALAVVAATAPETTRRALERLVAGRLLAATADEFEIAAPVQDFARSRAALRIPQEETAAIRDRLIGWYLATADAADQRIAPHRFRYRTERSGSRPHRMFQNRADALAWCDRLSSDFLAITEMADADGSPAAWQLPWALGGYFDMRRPADLQLEIHQVGLAAAIQRADVPGQAAMQYGLGLAHYYPRRFDDAATCFRRARKLWQRLGEPIGEATALNSLANVYLETRRFAKATIQYTRALEMFRAGGDDRGQAVVLTNLAETHCESGGFPAAADYARKALTAVRHIESPRQETMARCQLGRALAATGRTDESVPLFRAALEIARESGDRHSEAWALNYLGEHQAAHGGRDAVRTLEESVLIFEELGDPRSAGMRAQILALRRRA